MNEYKYQALFDEHNLSCECIKNGQTINSTAFRWVIDPISHDWNFMPNLMYDIARGAPRRINDIGDQLKCGYCAVSMFLSKEAALSKFMGMPQRIRNLVGYTSIAEGVITEEDGVICDMVNEHFNLYEFKDTNLKTRFVITATM